MIAGLFQVFHPLWHWGIDRSDVVWHLTRCCNWQITNLLGTMSSEVPLYREVILQNLAAGSMILAGFTLWFCCRSDQCWVSPKCEALKWSSAARSVVYSGVIWQKAILCFQGQVWKNSVNRNPVFLISPKSTVVRRGLELFDVVLMSLKWLCMP